MAGGDVFLGEIDIFELEWLVSLGLGKFIIFIDLAGGVPLLGCFKLAGMLGVGS